MCFVLLQLLLINTSTHTVHLNQISPRLAAGTLPTCPAATGRRRGPPYNRRRRCPWKDCTLGDTAPTAVADSPPRPGPLGNLKSLMR